MKIYVINYKGESGQEYRMFLTSTSRKEAEKKAEKLKEVEEVQSVEKYLL